MDKKKIDMADDIVRAMLPIKLSVVDPIIELKRGLREGSIPFLSLMLCGSIFSFVQYCGVFGYLAKKGGYQLHTSHFTNCAIGLYLLFFGFHLWGLKQVIVRRKLQKKLERVFLQSGLRTKMEEFPLFIFDRPLGKTTRKLRLRTFGIPISKFREAKESLESGLNVNLSKVENPKGNFEFADINYTLERMPECWMLTDFWKYKDFTFPVGKSLEGEIKASLRKIPHFLIAGETGGGKSTFIRAMVSVLVMNNVNLKVLFIDLKGGMENQVFDGFERVELLSEIPAVEDRLSEVITELETRMDMCRRGGFKNIDEYNASSKSSSDKLERILVVIDEAAEIAPTVANPNKGRLVKIQSWVNRITRLGRALGIHVVIGVQKPDHKNLDPTTKANLPGIVCFPVTHFTQSVVVLGNAHGAELNSEFPGRGIWKHGSFEVEIQAPFLTQEELNKGKEKMSQYFNTKIVKHSGGADAKEPAQDSPSPYKA